MKKASKLFDKATSFVGLGPACSIGIELADRDVRKQTEVVIEGSAQKFFVFESSDAVAGTVTLKLDPGKKIEHLGIKIQFLGIIEASGRHEFVSLVRELDPPGDLVLSKEHAFEFAGVDKPYDSYVGINCRVRYVVRVTIERKLGSVVGERELWVKTLQQPPEINNSIKMEVGIEDCLHIEFEYGKSKYHLKDVVIGKIYFLLVRLKIKHMEIEIRKTESVGSGADMSSESETMTKFEIMDGSPVRGEIAPVRLFLSGFGLTPSYKNIHNKFSVKYQLNLVLVDEDDRRYFKQQEIILWRRDMDQ